MKHGFFVMGKQDGDEFTFGKQETRHQVLKCYERAMRSNISEEVKKTLRIVELVENDITREFYE